jgi:hypothetical protein
MGLKLNATNSVCKTYKRRPKSMRSSILPTEISEITQEAWVNPSLQLGDSCFPRDWSHTEDQSGEIVLPSITGAYRWWVKRAPRSLRFQIGLALVAQDHLGMEFLIFVVISRPDLVVLTWLYTLDYRTKSTVDRNAIFIGAIGPFATLAYQASRAFQSRPCHLATLARP